MAKDYLKGLKDGTYPVSTVDEKAARILRLIFRTAMNRNRPWGSFTSEAHYDAARRIGEEGIVLLKNEPVKSQKSPLLPIDASKYEKILVVGDNATRYLSGGVGATTLKVKQDILPLESLQEMYGDKITYTQGYAAGKPRYGKVDRPKVNTDSLYRKALELSLIHI